MKVRRSTSYGIIPLIRKQEEWQCFLIQHRKSEFWGFPKGHAELKETPLQTAKRELYEETGLEMLQVLDPNPLIEQYTYQEGSTLVKKTVHFYLAVTSEKSALDPQEVLAGKWLSLSKAHEVISYKEGKALLEQVSHHLKAITV
jgi:8-oxo-dGTP pyrophosphatase MutT (NUDIX family)